MEQTALMLWANYAGDLTLRKVYVELRMVFVADPLAPSGKVLPKFRHSQGAQAPYRPKFPV